MSEPMLADIQQRLARLEARAQSIEHYAAETRRLVGPWAVSLADGRLLVHTLHSLLMVVDSTDLIITPQLVVYRQWEPELTQLLWNSCRRDTVFVDIGANVGYFTLLAGSRIHAGGSGRVIAIEPNPACCALIERNCIINWSMCDITLHKVAAGAEKDEVRLVCPTDRAANARVSKHGEPVEGERAFNAPLEPLDALIPESLAVDIMKIDVEGYELAVLKGAHQLLERSPEIKIVMEWSQKQMAEAGYSSTAMQDELKALGLFARRLPTSKSLRDITPENSPLLSPEELSEKTYDHILLTKQA